MQTSFSKVKKSASYINLKAPAMEFPGLGPGAYAVPSPLGKSFVVPSAPACALKSRNVDLSLKAAIAVPPPTKYRPETADGIRSPRTTVFPMRKAPKVTCPDIQEGPGPAAFSGFDIDRLVKGTSRTSSIRSRIGDTFTPAPDYSSVAVPVQVLAPKSASGEMTEEQVIDLLNWATSVPPPVPDNVYHSGTLVREQAMHLICTHLSVRPPAFLSCCSRGA